MIQSDDLEERLMEDLDSRDIVTALDRKRRGRRVEEAQRDLDYRQVYINSISRFKEEHPNYFDDRLLDQPRYQGKLIDYIMEELGPKSKEHLDRKMNKPFTQDLDEKTDGMVYAGEWYPKREFIKGIVREHRSDLGPEKFMNDMMVWEKSEQYGGTLSKLLGRAQAGIGYDRDSLKKVFRYAIREEDWKEAEKSIDWDIALGKRKHALGLIDQIDMQLQAGEKVSGSPIDPGKIKLGMDYIRKQDYFRQDLPKRSQADDYHASQKKDSRYRH